VSRVEEIIAAGRALVDEPHWLDFVTAPEHRALCEEFNAWYKLNGEALKSAWARILPSFARSLDGGSPPDHPARFIAIGALQSFIKRWLWAFSGGADWVRQDVRVTLFFTRTQEKFTQALPGQRVASPRAQTREGWN
jgi:hypothetical protein